MGGAEVKGLLIHVGAYNKPTLMDFETSKYDEFKYVTPKEHTHHHEDPDFKHFTYGDHIWKGARGNMKKLVLGDYIFFQATFANVKRERGKRPEKRHYLIAYYKLKEILDRKTLIDQGKWDKEPYCHNAHIKEKDPENFTLFVGDEYESKVLHPPLWLNRGLIKELDIRGVRSGRPIWREFGHKQNRSGRLMSDVEVINIYTRNPPLIDEEQVKILLKNVYRRSSLKMKFKRTNKELGIPVTLRNKKNIEGNNQKTLDPSRVTEGVLLPFASYHRSGISVPEEVRARGGGSPSLANHHIMYVATACDRSILIVNDI